MDNKLTNVRQLRMAVLESAGLIGQVADAAAKDIEALDNNKQDRLQRITDEEIDAIWAAE